MMSCCNRLFLLVVLVIVVATTSAVPLETMGLRGGSSSSSSGVQTTTQDITCTIHVEESLYAPSDDHPLGYEDERLVCEFSEEDKTRFGWSTAEILDASQTLDETTIQSGESLLQASTAIFDDRDGPTLFLPQTANVRVVAAPRERKLSSTKRTKGDFSVLVLRVVDSNGKGPKESIQELEEEIFTGDNCLKSQMEGCSYNKARILPFSGTIESTSIENGVLELPVDFDISQNDNWQSLNEAANDAATTALGDWKSKFDFIMFCMPQTGGNVHAVAMGHVSRYKDTCNHIIFQMHEVGHGFGLSHAGTQVAKYGDLLGYMGGSQTYAKSYRCYNPAHSFSLGWYDDQTKGLNPLSRNQDRTLLLNGIADYGQNPKAKIIVKLNQKSSQSSYFLGYNRKTGINSGTAQDGDKVTVYNKGDSPFGAATSMKLAALAVGESYTIEQFNGEQDVVVEFVGLEEDGRDAIVRVRGMNDNNNNNGGFDGACQDRKKKGKEGRKKGIYWKEEDRRIKCSEVKEEGLCNELRTGKRGKRKAKPFWYFCAASCNSCGLL